MSRKEIITSYICPSIPLRQFDWCAYYKDEDDVNHYGSGETEKKAIEDLLARYPARDGECAGCGITTKKFVTENGEISDDEFEADVKVTNAGDWYCHNDCYNDCH